MKISSHKLVGRGIMVAMVKITIGDNEANQRLDRFLRKYFKRASLSSIYKMIRKDVKLNGKRAREDTMLAAGDELTFYMAAEQYDALTAVPAKHTAKRQFKIAYEDADLLIVDKPKGLLTHGDSHEKKNTLVNQVCGYLQQQGEYRPSREKTFVPAPVNRLDRNTTGLVIFGKNAATLRCFTKLIRERDAIEKYYYTIVCGKLAEPLFLDDRLVKDEARNVVEVASEQHGKEAFTQVRPLQTGEQFSLAEVRIFTGRTHQIRVHLASAGFPLAGDVKYGDPKSNRMLKQYGITTQLLHAGRLHFAEMPAEFARLSGKDIEAPLPADFLKAKDGLFSKRRKG